MNSEVLVVKCIHNTEGSEIRVEEVGDIKYKSTKYGVWTVCSVFRDIISNQPAAARSWKGVSRGCLPPLWILRKLSCCQYIL